MCGALNSWNLTVEKTTAQSFDLDATNALAKSGIELNKDTFEQLTNIKSMAGYLLGGLSGVQHTPFGDVFAEEMDEDHEVAYFNVFIAGAEDGITLQVVKAA